MRDADLAGAHGAAWSSRILPSAVYPAALSQWLVHAPGRHAFWEHWMVALCHLRRLDGQRAALLKYPKAEHELLVMALEPGKPLDPDGIEWPVMQPAELVFQFDGLGDEKAQTLAEGYVKAIVEGGQTPDSDARRWWERTLTNVVNQYKSGKRRIIWLPASQTPAPEPVK